MAKQNFDKFIKKEVKGAKKKEQIKQEKKLAKKEREAFFIEKKREQRALKKLQQEQQNNSSYNKSKTGGENRAGKPLLFKKEKDNTFEKPAYQKYTGTNDYTAPASNYKKVKPGGQSAKKEHNANKTTTRPASKREVDTRPPGKKIVAPSKTEYNKPAFNTDQPAELTRRPKLLTAGKAGASDKPLIEKQFVQKDKLAKPTSHKGKAEDSGKETAIKPAPLKAEQPLNTVKGTKPANAPTKAPGKVRINRETLPIPEEFAAKATAKISSKTAVSKKHVENPVRPASKSNEADVMPLNKYIAHGGICSRRDAGELVKTGKVTVNGNLVTEPGTKVSDADTIIVAGKKVTPKQTLVYILLNKPKDFITTVEDPQGRKTVLDIVRGATPERIFPVGRLDRNTSGVLLLTNDGDLAQQLTHPSFEVRKIYEAKLDKPLTKSDFTKLLEGVELEDGKVQADSVAYADSKDRSIIGIEIHSGKNRVVRRMFEHLGYDVKGLDRVMFANLTKKNVDRGKWRFLSDKEVRLLKFFKSAGR